MSDRVVERALNADAATRVDGRVALGTHRAPEAPVDAQSLDLQPFEGVVIV